MHERPERHALTRLRERHNIEMTAEELQDIERRIGTKPLRCNPNLFRQVGCTQFWQVNLRRYFGFTLWVTVAYDAVTGRVMTALDVPLNVTPAEARRHICEYWRQRSASVCPIGA